MCRARVCLNSYVSGVYVCVSARLSVSVFTCLCLFACASVTCVFIFECFAQVLTHRNTKHAQRHKHIKAIKQ